MLIKAQQSDVESRACATEVEAEQALADLESKIKLYNSVARKLQLIPQTAKYANATCFEAAINPRAQTEETMVRNTMCVFAPFHRTFTTSLSRDCR